LIQKRKENAKPTPPKIKNQKQGWRSDEASRSGIRRGAEHFAQHHHTLRACDSFHSAILKIGASLV